MTWFLDTGLVTAAVGLATGPLVPPAIARIPEPISEDEALDEADAAVPEAIAEHEAEAVEEEPDEASGVAPGETEVEPATVAGVVREEPKELYATIAALPGLGWKCALACGVSAGLIGARIGWEWELLPLVPLVPVGVLLAVVDWRTRLLPTKVIAPLYGVVVGLCVVASLISGDWTDLRRAGWGWVLGGGTFLLLWIVYPRGMGYGDVRLSGVLGIALGYLGWGELVVGVYAGFLLGGVGGTLLTLLRIVDRRAYPFGPFMLLGALVGVLWGSWFAAFYTP